MNNELCRLYKIERVSVLITLTLVPMVTLLKERNFLQLSNGPSREYYKRILLSFFCSLKRSVVRFISKYILNVINYFSEGS